MEVNYLRVKERFNSGFREMKLDVFSPMKCEVALYCFRGDAFSLVVYHNTWFQCGKSVNTPSIPQPDELFSALDRVYSKLDTTALSYFGNVQFIPKCAYAYHDKEHDKHYVYFSPNWLSTLHVFRKSYYNFCQNFNSNNLQIS